MVTSTTIEASTSLFLNTTENSSASSYATKSSGFENAFQSANKAYDEGQNAKPETFETKAQTTTPQEKVKEKAETQSTNSETKDKVEATSQDNKDKVVESKKENNDSNEKKVETESKAEAAEKPETEDNKAATTDTTSTDAEVNAQQNTNLPSEAYQATVLTSNLIESLEQAAVSTIAATPAPATTDATQIATAVRGDATGYATPIQESAISLNTNLAQATQELPNNSENKLVDNTAKMQAQPARVEPQNAQSTQIQNLKTPAQQVEQAQQTQQTQQAIHVPTEATLQANVHSQIAATTAVKADAKVSTDVNTTTQNKTVLTQDMIDKTNAKIVNIEADTSNSSGNNNLLNKQNAQEQAIKFALEGKASSNNSINPELTGMNDATTQVNFSKTLDNIQTQAPKEISHTDLLAQINKQLDGLKEQATTKVTIVLRPENLGKINLELINGKDGLTARMTTDSQQVKELLDKSLNSLKETIGNQGVSVNSVSVKLNETQKQDNNFLFNGQTGQEQQQQSSNNSKQAHGNEFSFNKELNSASESESEITESTGSTSTTESTVSVGSHLGQVDYKV